MNAYEEKQEARRRRYEERAEQASRESDQLHERIRKHVDMIPFGQPILVGHHSEKRHRAHIRKGERMMRQAVDTSKKAEHYQRKAAGVGKGGISSDDPDAIAKLRDKLAGMEAAQETMKAANRIVKRKKGTEADKVAELVALGLREDRARELLQPDHVGRIGFPAYALTNNSANIRRVRERIAQLEQAAAREETEERHDAAGVTLRETANRTQLVFDGKPPAEVRALLKSRGFRWAPSEGAWQRFRSNAARYAAETIIAQLSA